MRYTFFFVLIGWSTSALSQQQQQQLSNVYLSNNSNLAIQIVQTNLINIDKDNNAAIQISQQGNLDENNSIDDISDEGLSNVRQSSSSGNAIDFNLSFKMPSRSSSSSSNSSSKSKSQKHTLSKKLKKFERNFYGKMGVHKKSKHLVDVCFNWR
ncbi:MAG: hypothetical protein U0W65_04535 [Bacteroidia bacterium]